MNRYNFTEDVRKVLASARQEASLRHHEYVGTEHILLAYTTPANGRPARLLQQAGARPEAVRAAIEGVIWPGQSRDVHNDLPYTSRAKKILELAMTETRERKHNFVGIEHLLIGIIREEKGIAAQVLADQGVGADAVRAQLPDQPPPGYVPPDDWPRDIKVIGVPAEDFVRTEVRGYAASRMRPGVVLAISAIWVALWSILFPEVLNWRLLGLILLALAPPILLWRLTRR